MKRLKRIWFVVLVILNLSVLFFPNAIYWFWTGNDFLANRLNRIYKRLIKIEL
jgi:hypothetical protein